MIKRVATAAVGIPLVYCAVAFFSPVAFCVCVVIIAALALDEFCRVSLQQNSISDRLGLSVMCFMVVAAAFVDITIYKPSDLFPGPGVMVCFCIILTGLFVYHILRAGDVQQAFRRIVVTFFGLWYIAFLFSYVMVIRQHEHGIDLLLFLLFITWAGDIGAYVTGTWKGKIPLAPEISPKKTVEGSLGGLLFSLLTAYGCVILFFHDMGFINCFVITVCVNILNQLGDLSESLIKRASGVSDSGTILPGHGGVLDRIDSLLFAAPCIYYYAYFTAL